MSSGLPPAEWKPRILVTRAAHQSSVLAEELRSLGAEPVVIPIIEIVEPDSFEALDYALSCIAEYDWLLFTSANAVNAFAERAASLGASFAAGDVKVAAIGSATQHALQERGIPANVIPATAVAEALAEALIPFARKGNGEAARFLLVRAQEGRDYLPEALKAAGAEVTVAPAYRTRMPRHGLEALRDCFGSAEGAPEGVMLTSSSAARNLFAMLSAAGVQLGANTAVASIGPITSHTLRELGRPPDVEASEATVRALAEAMIDFVQEKRSRRNALEG